jgi:hypothetical protein
MMMAGGGGGDTGFFGAFSMLREFWAEDPDWTNPGDGGAVDGTPTWRDNGTIGEDLTATTRSGGSFPIYRASFVNGHPAIEFISASDGSGGCLHTGASAGSPSGTFTKVVVGRIDLLTSGRFPYLTDGRTGTVFAAFGGHSSANTWTIYNTATLNSNNGTWDTDWHIFVGLFKTNDLHLYVDNVDVASDTSGTVSLPTGFTLGADRALTASFLDGAIAYAAEFDGDLTAESGYSDWIDEIMAHYGL